MFHTLKEFFSSLYFTSRYYAFMVVVAGTLVVAYFYDWLSVVAQVSLATLIILPLFDIVVLYLRRGIIARRETPERLSNGDDNEIFIHCENSYGFSTIIDIVDEIPHQFQKRDVKFRYSFAAGEAKTIRYTLRPTERGDYSFGATHLYVRSLLGFAERKYSFQGSSLVPVYPSFLQMRKYELLAATNRLVEVGVKRIRRIGHAKEFDQIREYVIGDEYRTINWNATARHSQLMVNQYQDEKSQHVYSLIDMGRAMKMPFEGLSLLDYAINSSLVISNIAMMKDDKAGIIAFSESMGAVLKADRGKGQLRKILELLYNQRTRFREPSYELLYSTVKRTIHQRSLLFLYTNFESLSSLKRQLKYFTMLAQSHVLCVVFFENTELHSLLESSPKSLEDIYIKVIGEKFAYEKKLIVSELDRHGIYSIYTAPQNLSVNTINKYLELKARGII